ncbi:MAG TPA: HAD family hydrolase [Dissulfurispiraceae bacterium]
MVKTAIVDIDNTLWQFCDPFFAELRKINQDFPPIHEWTHWDIWEGYCSLDAFLGAVSIIHAHQDSEQYVPYPDAKAFLSSLREKGYHITIASHRSPDYREPTEKWLGKHGLVYDDLHLSFHKTRLINTSTTVVVDDHPEVLGKAVENGVKAVGLSFPWNREYSNNGFILRKSLSEIQGCI